MLTRGQKAAETKRKNRELIAKAEQKRRQEFLEWKQSFAGTNLIPGTVPWMGETKRELKLFGVSFITRIYGGWMNNTIFPYRSIRVYAPSYRFSTYRVHCFYKDEFVKSFETNNIEVAFCFAYLFLTDNKEPKIV